MEITSAPESVMVEDIDFINVYGVTAQWSVYPDDEVEIDEGKIILHIKENKTYGRVEEDITIYEHSLMSVSQHKRLVQFATQKPRANQPEGAIARAIQSRRQKES